MAWFSFFSGSLEWPIQCDMFPSAAIKTGQLNINNNMANIYYFLLLFFFKGREQNSY